MPRIIPEPRYFSMPSIEVGADVRMKRALNCWPWVWSLTHSPDAVIHSPAEIVAAWPMTVTRSRWPRAFARRTQKPFSLLWKVTRSTKPASTSWVDGSCCGLICVAAVGASPELEVFRTEEEAAQQYFFEYLSVRSLAAAEDYRPSAP